MKEPWKGISLFGEVEADFLFATLLSTHLLPFGWRKLSLLVLPLTIERGRRARLVTWKEAINRGKTGLAEWLGRAEALWEVHLGRHGGEFARFTRGISTAVPKYA